MVEGEFVSIALDQDCDICRLVTSEPLVSCDLCLSPLPRNVTMGFNAICEPVHETMRGHHECFMKAHKVLRQSSSPYCPSPGSTRRSSSVPGSPRLSLFRTSRSAGSTPSSPRLQQPNILRSRSMPSSPRQPTRSDVMLLNGTSSQSNLASMENLSMSISIQSFSSLEDSVSRVQSPIMIRISGVDESEGRPSNPTPSRAHALRLESAHSSSAEDIRRPKRENDSWEPVSYSSYFDLTEYTRGQHGIDLNKMEVDSPRPSSRCDSLMFDDASDYNRPKSPNSDVSDHISDPICVETNISYCDDTADNTPSSCSDNLSIATEILPSITQEDPNDSMMSSTSDTNILNDMINSQMNTSDNNSKTSDFNRHIGPICAGEDYVQNKETELSTNATCDIKVANMQLLTVFNKPESTSLRKGHSSDSMNLESSDSSNSDCSSYTVCDMSLSRESALSDNDPQTLYEICQSVTGHMNNSLHITNSTNAIKSSSFKETSLNLSPDVRLEKQIVAHCQPCLMEGHEVNVGHVQITGSHSCHLAESSESEVSDCGNAMLHNNKKLGSQSKHKTLEQQRLHHAHNLAQCECQNMSECQHKMSNDWHECESSPSNASDSLRGQQGGSSTPALGAKGSHHMDESTRSCVQCNRHEWNKSGLRSADMSPCQHCMSERARVTALMTSLQTGLRTDVTESVTKSVTKSTQERQQQQLQSGNDGQPCALSITSSSSNNAAMPCSGLTMTHGTGEIRIIDEATGSRLGTQLSTDQTGPGVDLLSGQRTNTTEQQITSRNKTHMQVHNAVRSSAAIHCNTTGQNDRERFPPQSNNYRTSLLSSQASAANGSQMQTGIRHNNPFQSLNKLQDAVDKRNDANTTVNPIIDSQSTGLYSNNRRSLNLDYLSSNQGREKTDVKTKNHFRKSWDTSLFSKMSSTILTEPVYTWTPGSKSPNASPNLIHNVSSNVGTSTPPQILSEPQSSWSPLRRPVLKHEETDSDSDRDSGSIISVVDVKGVIDEEESSMSSSTTSTSSQMSHEGPPVSLRGGDIRRRRQLCNRSMSYTYGSGNVGAFHTDDNPSPMEDSENADNGLRSGHNTPGSASQGVVVAAIASLRRDRLHSTGRRRPTSMYNMRHPSVAAAFEFDTNQYLRSKFSLARQSWCSCSQDFLFPRRSSKHRLILDNLREGNGNGETFTLTKSPNSSPPQVSPQSDAPQDQHGTQILIESVSEDRKDPPDNRENIVMITDCGQPTIEVSKYTKEKLRCRTKEDLVTLMEQFYKQIHTVSEELVELLQIRHEMQEQIEMRKIAIEQLLRLQNSEGSVIDATGILPSSSR